MLTVIEPDGKLPVFDVATQFANLFMARHEKFIYRAGRKEAVIRSDGGQHYHIEFRCRGDMMMVILCTTNYASGIIGSAHHYVPLGDPECYDKLVQWVVESGCKMGHGDVD